MGASTPDEANRQRLADTACEQMLHMIALGEIDLGARITEPFLCERLGMSRTPVREAINRLVNAGLLVSVPHAGVSLRVLKTEELLELWAVREALESQAARLAAPKVSDDDLDELDRLCDEMDRADAGVTREDGVRYRQADRAFHERLVELSGNRMLAQVYANQHLLQLSLFGYRLSVLPAYAVRYGSLGRVHRPIVEALRSRDPEQADRAVRTMFARTVELHRKTLAALERDGVVILSSAT